MSTHPFAGKPVRPQDRINIGQLVSNYFLKKPDVNVLAERVTFGTSGHRGSANKCSFNEHHIIAICQAIAEYGVRLRACYIRPKCSCGIIR